MDLEIFSSTPQPQQVVSAPLYTSEMAYIKGQGERLTVSEQRLSTALVRFMEVFKRDRAGDRYNKPKPIELKNAVAEVVVAIYDLVYVRSSDTIYGRHISKGEVVYDYYDDRQLENLARDYYQEVFGSYDDRLIKSIAQTIKITIRSEMDRVDGQFTQIAPDLLWDRDNTRLVRVSESGDTPRVFRRLFDSKIVAGDQVRVPQDELTSEFEQVVKDNYEMVLEELRHKKFVQHLQPIKEWACGEEDVYRDIMYMYANVFMKKKQLGAFFLEGVGRNGKSAAIALARSLIGTNNSTSVNLNKMGDPSFARDLSRTLLNCPDEVSESIIADQEIFREVAAHSEITAKRYFSQDPMRIVCDFVCIFPVNHIPKWTGNSADACVKRTLAIPFNADFSGIESPSDNWAEETFNPRFMAELTGQVLAYASYFSRHRWELSETMLVEQSDIEESTAPQFVYQRMWSQVFDGYEKFSTVQKDYDNWCSINEIPESERGVIKSNDIFWRRYKRSTVTVNGHRYNIYKYTEKGAQPKRIMFDNISDPRFTNGMKLIKYIEFGSIIARMEEEECVYRDPKKKSEYLQNKQQELIGRAFIDGKLS